MGGWRWKKLVVDGKVMHVCPRSKIPKTFNQLKTLIGIELLEATKEERKPFLLKEKRGGHKYV